MFLRWVGHKINGGWISTLDDWEMKRYDRIRLVCQNEFGFQMKWHEIFFKQTSTPTPKHATKTYQTRKKKFVCKTTNFQLTLRLYRHESTIKTTYIHTRLQYITTEVDTSMIWTCWFITCTIIRQSISCTEGEFPRRPLTRHLLVNMHISLGDIYISIIIRWANDLHGHLILKYMFNIPWEVSAKRKVTIKTSFTLTGKNVHVLPFMTTTALLASHLGH